MPAYIARWTATHPNNMPVDVPADALGVTVTPSLDGSDTLVVAWLEPAPAPSQEETE